MKHNEGTINMQQLKKKKNGGILRLAGIQLSHGDGQVWSENADPWVNESHIRRG